MIYKIKKGGNSKDWISKAVNPKHKGYCTPMTKETCTPKRKALAETFKKMAKKKESGGEVMYKDGIKNKKVIPKMANMKDGAKLTKEYIKKAHEKPGGSNVGKKKFASGEPRTGPYVGPSGGAPKGSYPIPDLKHAKSALSLAHNAPNPQGIKDAVYRKYPTLKHKNGGVINYNITDILSQWKK